MIRPLMAAALVLILTAPLSGEDRYLVLVELAGGNDGLNTVVPWTDPLYRSLRPRLALGADDVVPLTATLGLNRALGPVLPLWQAGEMAVVQGIGYADQNRSHFRSVDIWETASDSRQVLTRGWVTEAVPLWAGTTAYLADGIVLGESRPGPLRGSPRVLHLQNAEAFLRQTQGLTAASAPNSGSPDQRLWAQSQTLVAEARGFFQTHPGLPLDESVPEGIRRQFAAAADLIRRGTPVPVVKLTLRGFDTHVGQRADHDALLADLAQGVWEFRQDLGPLWDRVLVMTYSEFGRRVAENGSLGTDHGAGSVSLVWGGRVAGGLYGPAPDLARLTNGDLTFGQDYRRLWAAGGAFLGRPWSPTQTAEPIPLLKPSPAP